MDTVFVLGGISALCTPWPSGKLPRNAGRCHSSSRRPFAPAGRDGPDADQVDRAMDRLW